MTKLNRIAGAAAVFVVALMAASVPLKSATADNDNWQHHRNTYGDWDNHHRDWDRGQGSFYFYSRPNYYYAPAPTYYYYSPPPAYYYPPAYYGPSFGFSVRVR